MSRDFIPFGQRLYPRFQSEGFASQFAIPFAKHVCKGVGLDIGCGKPEWAFPNAIQVDPEIAPWYSATELPKDPAKVDYIFSSHCLEHLDDWVGVLDCWSRKLNKNGVLFLYLPHYNQEYWRPWNNRKHKNIFTPQIIRDYMENRGYINIFNSERDLNDSFMIYGYKGV